MKQSTNFLFLCVSREVSNLLIECLRVALFPVDNAKVGRICKSHNGFLPIYLFLAPLLT